jgi:uncharacterized protein YqgC (DUF456 family)
MTLSLLPFDPLSPLPGVLVQALGHARPLAAGMALPLGVSLELPSLPWHSALPPLHRADLAWWGALLIQVLAIPGTLLPVLPGLALLPLGALVWCLATGFATGWPTLVFAGVLLLLGWGADALGLVLGAARMQATRWAYIGSAIGLMVGLFGLLPALPVGGPLVGALVGPLLGASVGELLSAPTSLGPLGLLRLKRSLLVGLAVVAGMLVSRLAQFLLSLVGVVGFVLLSTGVFG